ncbi:MAG: VOC family protein [Oligoflexia bacterium]|nr:VOC family protein [Oligoflexia bacterium]
MPQGQLHHIEIYVSNLSSSIRFWSWFLCEQLGYQEYQRWDQGVSYKANGTYIVFVQTEAKYLTPSYHRCRSGLNHLAFYANSKEQVDKITIAVKERGMTILYQDRHPYAGGSSYALFFEDPDRIKVELVCENIK